MANTARSLDDTWRRLFVGRDEELRWLIDRWHEAKAGIPRFLVLLAESGLGKTRLVQEFYRWLTRNEDPHTEAAPEGYWPDAFKSAGESLAVNPTFDADDRPRSKIPWLWWGMRSNSPEVRNPVGTGCALRDSQEVLQSHTQPIAVARRLKRVRAEAGWKVGSIFSNLVPWAGLVFSARDLFSLLSGDLPEHQALAHRAGESPGQVHQRERIELESLALDYCRTILDPQNAEAETVPVILFLDAAQWADATTLRFLRRLLADARRGRWPLLVIATHLEAEWRTNVLEHPKPADPPERLTDLPPLLNLPHEWPGLCHIHPVADLGAIIEVALPGLSRDQQVMLSTKAGGNPLLLEEVLKFLLQSRQLFVGRDTAGPLTSHAVEEIHWRTFELHELVRDRFARLEENVKRALGWSSEQGMRFLAEITLAASRRVAPDIGDEELRKALRRGESPHCLIHLDQTQGRFNLGEFRQAAFHEIAAEHLGFDPAELETVRAAVCDTLIGWLSDGSIDRLPAAERRDALLMARRVLQPAEDSPSELWSAWGHSLVHLARLYADEFLWEQAWEVARAFADARPTGWNLAFVPFWYQIEIIHRLCEARDYTRAATLARSVNQQQLGAVPTEDCKSLRDLSVSLGMVGDVEWALGHHDAAREAYHRGLEISERIARDCSPMPGDLFDLTAVGTILVGQLYSEAHESLRDLSLSLGRVGYVELALGHFDTARQAFCRGLEIDERIVRDYAETPQSLRDLSVSLDQVGDVELALGRREVALGAYRRGLEIFERIVRDYGETPRSLRDLGISLGRVGGVERALGHDDAAREAYHRALEIDERIARDYGETPESLRDLSVSLNRVGDVELALGHREAAEQAYRRGLEISERIARDYGETPASLRDLSVSLGRVGGVERALGHHDAAREAYHRALEVDERIARDYGETPESLRDLSVSLDRVGDVELALGHPEAAERAYRRGLEISERIARDYGQTRKSLHDLSVSLERVGDVERALGHWEAALEVYRRALDIRERIVRDYGETSGGLRDRGISLRRVGDVELALGRHDAAWEAYRRGLQISERIAQDYGETTESLHDLNVSLERVGDVERALGHREAALEVYRRALEIRERIARENGETLQRLRDLSVLLNQVADVELALGHRARALETYRRGLGISERIARDYGASPESLRDLSVSLHQIGDLELALGHREAAQGAYRRGLEIFERIARDYDQTPQSLHDLVVSEYKLAVLDRDAGDNESATTHLQRAKQLIERILDAGWPQNEEDRREIDEMLKQLGN